MAKSGHSTLVATTVATITVDASAGGSNFVEIVNRTAGQEVFATFDGSTPAVDGAGSVCIPPNFPSRYLCPGGVVKVISSGTPKVSVTRL